MPIIKKIKLGRNKEKYIIVLEKEAGTVPIEINVFEIRKVFIPIQNPTAGQDTVFSEVKLEVVFDNGILCSLYFLVGQNAFQCQTYVCLRPRICRVERLIVFCSLFAVN
jgi:hypothetical protein